MNGEPNKEPIENINKQTKLAPLATRWVSEQGLREDGEASKQPEGAAGGDGCGKFLNVTDQRSNYPGSGS